MQKSIPPTRREALFTFSVGSKRKGLITSSASQNLNNWGSASPMTAGTDNTLSTPSMGRSCSTRIKLVYHTLTPKKIRTWPSNKPSRIILTVSPRSKFMWPNLLADSRECLAIHLWETLSSWWATTCYKTSLLIILKALILTPCLVQTSLLPGARQCGRSCIARWCITLLYLSIFWNYTSSLLTSYIWCLWTAHHY